MRQAVYIVVCCLVLLADSAFAFRPNTELGGSFGGMNYLGDLNNQSMLGQVSPAGSFYIRHNYTDRWAVAFLASFGHIQQDKDVLSWRNLSFRSMLAEAGIRVEFNFVSFGEEVMQFRTTPFIFGGLAYYMFNPKARYTNASTNQTEWVSLSELGTEGQMSDLYPDRYPYNLYGLSMPFGFGFKAMLSKNFVISVEYGFRKTWTDYLDDVSTTYVRAESFESNEIAASLADKSEVPNMEGSQRGDDSLDDWYSYFNVTLTISGNILFGWMKSKKCYNN